MQIRDQLPSSGSLRRSGVTVVEGAAQCRAIQTQSEFREMARTVSWHSELKLRGSKEQILEFDRMIRAWNRSTRDEA